jgi:hypothetical protein
MLMGANTSLKIRGIRSGTLSKGSLLQAGSKILRGEASVTIRPMYRQPVQYNLMIFTIQRFPDWI